ncbi:hypothetical protein, partial [Corynebacterium bovis]|uniref:hypothetical protein n=1 Tax=Corynebacterium bovis TaxID=36808 RepID=UPI001C8A76E5
PVREPFMPDTTTTDHSTCATHGTSTKDQSTWFITLLSSQTSCAHNHTDQAAGTVRVTGPEPYNTRWQQSKPQMNTQFTAPKKIGCFVSLNRSR